MREPGVGGTRAGAEPLRRVRFCRTAGPFFETRPRRDQIFPNDLNLVENKQIGAVDITASTDVEPGEVNMSDKTEHESKAYTHIFMDPRTTTIVP